MSEATDAIDAKIAGLGDRRGAMLDRVRVPVREAAAFNAAKPKQGTK